MVVGGQKASGKSWKAPLVCLSTPSPPSPLYPLSPYRKSLSLCVFCPPKMFPSASILKLCAPV